MYIISIKLEQQRRQQDIVQYVELYLPVHRAGVIVVAATVGLHVATAPTPASALGHAAEVTHITTLVPLSCC